MRPLIAPHALLLLVVSGLLAAPGVRYVVARTAPGGAVTYETYENILINGRDSVRALAPKTDTIEAKSYSKTPAAKIASIGALRRTGSGIVVQLKGTPAVWTPLAPDSLKLKGSMKLAEAWQQIGIAVQKTKKDKPVKLGMHDFLAVLPATDPASAAVSFVLDAANFESTAEHGAAIIGVRAAFTSAPATEQVLADLTRRLQEANDELETGAPYSRFLVAVEYAGFSQKAFPQDPTLAQLSRQILERRQWIETTRRTLQSLSNNGNWDSFLQMYIDFERYQRSFPDLMETRKRAYEESARFHARLGGNLVAQKKYREGLAEYRIALSRDPVNNTLADLTEKARLQASVALAAERAPLRRPLAPGSPEAIQFNRHVEFAGLFIEDRKMKEAEEAIAAAGEIDKDSPALLLLRAKYHAGLNQLVRANQMLDAYDEAVLSPEERAGGEKVRVQVLYRLSKAQTEYKPALDGALKSGRFTEGLDLAARSLEVDENDPDFLFYAGIFAGIFRQPAAALKHLNAFLEASDSLRGDPEKRDRVMRLIRLLQSPRGASLEGLPNWFSGRKLSADIFYCPDSLTLQPRISAIHYGDVDVVFEWSGQALASIRTKFGDEKDRQEWNKAVNSARSILRAGPLQETPQPEPAGTFFFEYYPGHPQVARTACLRAPKGDGSPLKPVAIRDAEGRLRLEPEAQGDAAKGPQGVWHYPVLLSNPIVDPDILALVDRPVTLTVAGNSFFSPFVWDGLHIFRTTYDSLGRVDTAQEIGVENVVRFQWNGDRLVGVSAYAGKDTVAAYSRSLGYEAGRLMSETATVRGKSYKIEYKYEGGKLVEANGVDPAGGDGKSRRVRFLP